MALAPPKRLVPNPCEGKKGFMDCPFKPVAPVKPANLAISANEGGGDAGGMPTGKCAMDANEGREDIEGNEALTGEEELAEEESPPPPPRF